ncbi:hypothetical protein CBOM_01403 [Ceraceosorus bombacis]|uniref:Uncharacterized protein n=1 Tax=Ceraceosorus bombacis TaxID=401625 RepID=A0A0N7L9D5_9BASI|nr:hypothetical protein CBOM_01403 [Ceraceosorus bombacis]
MSSSPTHGRGTAAEQGARIRAQMAARSSTASSPTSSPAHSRAGSKSHSRSASQSQNPAEAPSSARISQRVSKPVEQKVEQPPVQEKPRESDSAEQRPPPPQAKTSDEKTVADNATDAPKSAEKDAEKTAAGAAVGAGALAGAGAAAVTSSSEKGRQTSSHPLDPRGRVIPFTGIDNLALLMENDGYSTACYSMYLFKTVIDDETIFQFFEKLADSYPKYRYRIELSPWKASSDERARRKAEKRGEIVARKTPTEQEKRGRRSHVSGGIKAGGLFRPARWVYDDHFETRDNITFLDSLPGGAKDEKALFDQAGKFLGQHFDFAKPVWHALVVRGIETSEGAKSALIVKVHHCFSDGQGMIMSYHSALGAMQMDKPVSEVQAYFDRKTGSGKVKKPGQRNIKPSIWGTTKHGFHTARGLWMRSRKVFEYGKPANAAGPGNRAPNRLYYHSDGIAMSDIKLIRKAFSNDKVNLSLNDVACGILSRALRLAADRTEPKPVKDKRTAVFIPISVRPQGNWSLNNFTTGAVAWFAFYDPKDKSFDAQLQQVHREMNRIKRSWWPRIWFSSFGTASKHRIFYLPNYFGLGWAFEKTYREYHVATNVPGPPKPVEFGQHKAFSYHVLPPSSPGKSSLSCGMISYADDFSLAVSCDDAPELRKNRLPEEICRAFQDASKELIEAAKEKLGTAGGFAHEQEAAAVSSE